MAEIALKKLEEELNCPICLDTYTDPKLLQCFHIYCQECLVPLQGQLGITCPNCRQVTPVPDRGVAGLQPAFHINRLLEIQESYQKKLQDPEATLEEAAPTDVNPVKKTRYCFVHEGKELELYCETCEELICWKCVVRNGEHQDHDYNDLDQALEKYKQEIVSYLEPMDKQVATIEKAIRNLDACYREISHQQTSTEEKIHGTFKQLHEILDARETELIGQLKKETRRKLKGLAAQRNEIETTLAQLCSCLHFMRESLKAGDEEDVLMMKTNAVTRVKELITPFQPDFLDPTAEADIVFSSSEDMTTSCWNYGQVFYPELPDLSKCHMVKLTEVANSENSYAILQAIDFRGEPCKTPFNDLDCKLVSKKISLSCRVKRKGVGKYEIWYPLTINGKHQLHITSQGQHLAGSPFNIEVSVWQCGHCTFFNPVAATICVVCCIPRKAPKNIV